jgi:uncharacterized protein YjbI with pentapeptide repeats
MGGLERRRRLLRWAGIRGSTLRDWLPILIAAIPILIFLGTRAITLQQADLENQRAAAEAERAAQRAQDEALQAYLDQMSQLMLGDSNLLEAEPGVPVHALAQAKTSTVILRLDAEHNQSVTRFLSDSGLVTSSEGSPRLLRGITLRKARLIAAYLPKADLSNAVLFDTDLNDADLHGADLSDAKGTTKEQLEQAKSLQGATMPDGQLYQEDWLPYRERRGEDGENSGPS